MKLHTSVAIATSLCLHLGFWGTQAAAETGVDQPKACAADKTGRDVQECERSGDASDSSAMETSEVTKAQLRATVSACSKLLSADHSLCNRANALRYIGTAYLAGGDPKQSIEYLSRAIAVRPKDTWAFTDRGKAYLTLGELDEAIADFKQAAVLDESIGHGTAQYMILAHIYHKREEHDLAIDYITKSIENAPEGVAYNQIRSDGYKYRGELWSRKGDSAKAEADFARARVLDASQK